MLVIFTYSIYFWLMLMVNVGRKYIIHRCCENDPIEFTYRFVDRRIIGAKWLGHHIFLRLAELSAAYIHLLRRPDTMITAATNMVFWKEKT